MSSNRPRGPRPHRKIWQETGPNHLLDCRIYAMAMAEYVGPSRLRLDQWARLARERSVPPVVAEPDLLAPAPIKIATKPALVGRAMPARGRRVLSRGI